MAQYRRKSTFTHSERQSERAIDFERDHHSICINHQASLKYIILRRKPYICFVKIILQGNLCLCACISAFIYFIRNGCCCCSMCCDIIFLYFHFLLYISIFLYNLAEMRAICESAYRCVWLGRWVDQTNGIWSFCFLRISCGVQLQFHRNLEIVYILFLKPVVGSFSSPFLCVSLSRSRCQSCMRCLPRFIAW